MFVTNNLIHQLSFNKNKQKVTFINFKFKHKRYKTKGVYDGIKNRID